MNVLFLTLSPFSSLSEGHLAADLAQELINRGLNLTVISPTLDTREKKSYIKCINDKYTHIYLACGPIQKVDFIRKKVGLIKLDFLARVYLHKHKQKYDLIITMVSHGAFYQTVKKLKTSGNGIIYNMVKDIFPENGADLGLINRKSFIYRTLRNQEIKYFKVSDFLGAISPASVDYLLRHNLFLNERKVEYNPNSIIPREINLSPEERDRIRGLYDVKLDDVLCLYGGNLGIPQGIDFLLDCIVENEKRQNTVFIIVGNGTEYGRIESFLSSNKIRNTRLYPSVSQSDFRILANCADIGLVFLNKLFKVPNFPSRVLAYMEAKLPVLFAVDSVCDAGKMAEENNFGLNCLSGDLIQFNEKLNLLIKNKNLRQSLGKNAFLFLNKEFTIEKSVDLILSHINIYEKIDCIQ
ncbi:MAG: glycosyltransferase family 4 protein [Candidatus Treponema excrementipullorum]|nr:glycosyltransferase family 4 protein [Candidatus Treponema excrementipullorum]